MTRAGIPEAHLDRLSKLSQQELDLLEKLKKAQKNGSMEEVKKWNYHLKTTERGLQRIPRN